MGYPSAVDNVWFEGSFGCALAYWRAGDYSKYNQILEDLKQFEEEDGSYKYAVLRDETYEISNYKSIASTAWNVIASKLKNTVWK